MRAGPGEDVGMWMDGGGALRMRCLGHEEDGPWGAADFTPIYGWKWDSSAVGRDIHSCLSRG